jgi:hypothetical protein
VNARLPFRIEIVAVHARPAVTPAVSVFRAAEIRAGGDADAADAIPRAMTEAAAIRSIETDTPPTRPRFRTRLGFGTKTVRFAA